MSCHVGCQGAEGEKGQDRMWNLHLPDSFIPPVAWQCVFIPPVPSCGLAVFLFFIPPVQSCGLALK